MPAVSQLRAPSSYVAPVLAVARTFAIVGVEAIAVDAEVDIQRGLPTFSVVGLPDAAVRESRERVRAAIVNSGFEFPQKRITVSLAPSDLRKAGPGFDLAIAATVLVASSQLPEVLLEDWAFAGELALDGRVRGVRGALAMADAAHRAGARGIAVAAANHEEAALVEELAIAPVERLPDLRALGRGELGDGPEPPRTAEEAPPGPDLADLRGQPTLRRGLELAAAGGHSLLVVGPPGSGKTLGARRLPSILPPLSPSEAIEVARVAGIAGLGPGSARRSRRPFRAPHHTISAAGLVGGGTPPRPGEITLAHRGVLFLDEVAEFSRPALESLRQPLEAGELTIARAQGALRFPARFQLIAAANPCPCGRGESDPRCGCGSEQVRRYSIASQRRARRSDRHQPRRRPARRRGPGRGPLGGLRRGARARLRGSPCPGGPPRGGRDQRRLRRRRAAALGSSERGREAALWRTPSARYGLSGRGWTRALRVARTAADLDGSEQVEESHVLAALALRERRGEP